MRTPTILALLTSLLLAPWPAQADWLQLERADTGAYISHARVEVRGRADAVGYTDFFGRIEVSLPNGRYVAVVSEGDWRGEFTFQIDGRNVVKVYRLE